MFNRRRFLTAIVATGTGLLLPRRLSAEESTVDPNLVVLMADTHIPKDRNHIVKRIGVKPVDKFEAIVTNILELNPRPAGIIVAGDCASPKGAAEAYATLAKLLQPFGKASIPVRLVPGNHDCRENFVAAHFGAKPAGHNAAKELDKCVSIWETPYANWFLLDSLDQTGVASGRLGETQLAWLANSLDARPNKPALIVAHHHLDPLGIGGLIDTGALLDVLQPRKQVKAYFHGHTHCWSARHVGNLMVVNLPSTALPFFPTEPYGFVTVQLHSRGGAVVLHALDPLHPKNGEKFDWKWQYLASTERRIDRYMPRLPAESVLAVCRGP